jgi:hypothetical protein
MTACMHSSLLWSFLERLNFGAISTPCILGTVTARQNHVHITFRDLNEEYKEESIHQHCMKNEHPHTKTKQTLFITFTIAKGKRTKTMSTNNGLQNTTQKTKEW